MLATLIAGAATRFGVPAWLVKIAGALILAGLCVATWLLWLHFHDRGVVSADRAKANLEVTTRNAGAHDKAADERLADDRAIAAHEKEMHDAIHSVPDSPPDAARVRLGCERLRRAGKDLARIPACSGSEGGH